ncbi:MAG: cysteine desulfurase [Bacteroidetes bacterium]|nr:cysteine desulfurase [Bacteroidota bacterium]
MIKPNIYMDNNSTTKVDDLVLEAMLPYFTEKYGNSSSKQHSFGWIAEEAVNKSRNQVAALLNCEAEEIIFTSGATESINMALIGIFNAYKTKGNEIITTTTEHPAVLATCKYFENEGAIVHYLNPDKNGIINPELIKSVISDKTILVCIILANNETGVIQPIYEISKIVHSLNSILFSDATQAIGKIPIDVKALGIDVLCLSAHKFYGPKGIGAIYKRRKNPRVAIKPIMFGGGQENDLRSGTLNIPGIVGLGQAAEIVKNEMSLNYDKTNYLRENLEKELLILGGKINGKSSQRLPNTISFTFNNFTAEKFIKKTKSFLAVSTGSACASTKQGISHVLKAMGVSEEEAKSTIRFSLGKNNTIEEINYLIEQLNAEN